MLLNMLLKFRNLTYYASPEGKLSPGSHKGSLSGIFRSHQGYPQKVISDFLQNIYSSQKLMPFHKIESQQSKVLYNLSGIFFF